MKSDGNLLPINTEYPSSRTVLVLALLSSILQYLSFFPANLGSLGWVALTPLLVLSKFPLPRQAGWVIWSCCFAQYLCSLRWMMVADERMIATWILLAWWCSLFPITGIHLLRLLSTHLGLPLAILAPLIWIPLEHSRAYLLTGFPWYYLAHTQHEVIPLLQTADIAGTQLLTFIVALSNGWVADLLLFIRPWFLPLSSITRKSILLATGTGGIILILLSFAYGKWKISVTLESLEPGPKIVSMQGNHPQAARNDETYFDGLWDDYLVLLGRAKKLAPDLIVWPETSFPFEIQTILCEAGPLMGKPRVGDSDSILARKSVFSGPSHLLGASIAIVDNGTIIRRHNSALLQDIAHERVVRYDKIHRVPFGEYLPMKDYFPGMNLLSPYTFDYSISSGNCFPRFPVQGDKREYIFTTLICYEDSDFILARLAAGADGLPRPDFLVNQSNDGWFKGTEEHEQHLAVARFRAVETRRSLIRSVNMGISALVDPIGRVLTPNAFPGDPSTFEIPQDAINLPGSQWHLFKAKPLVILATIPICHADSIYMLYGDWLAWMMDIILFITLTLSCRLSYKSKYSNPRNPSAVCRDFCRQRRNFS